MCVFLLQCRSRSSSIPTEHIRSAIWEDGRSGEPPRHLSWQGPYIKCVFVMIITVSSWSLLIVRYISFSHLFLWAIVMFTKYKLWLSVMWIVRRLHLLSTIKHQKQPNNHQPARPLCAERPPSTITDRDGGWMRIDGREQRDYLFKVIIMIIITLMIDGAQIKELRNTKPRGTIVMLITLNRILCLVVNAGRRSIAKSVCASRDPKQRVLLYSALVWWVYLMRLCTDDDTQWKAALTSCSYEQTAEVRMRWWSRSQRQ